MSMEEKEVERAAAYLDSMVEKIEWLTADWRSKIDTSTLNMASSEDCILGQLHPSERDGYGDAYDDLRAIDRGGFEKTRAAFAMCRAEWLEYLGRPIAKAGIDESVVWVSKDGLLNDPPHVKNVNIDGVDYVAFVIVNCSTGLLYTVEQFLRYYKPKPVPRFKVGDLLWNGEPKSPHFLVRDMDGDEYGLIRIGAGNNIDKTMGYCSLKMAERWHGALEVRPWNPFKDVFKNL